MQTPVREGACCCHGEREWLWVCGAAGAHEEAYLDHGVGHLGRELDACALEHATKLGGAEAELAAQRV
jgi:hypothetical protein